MNRSDIHLQKFDMNQLKFSPHINKAPVIILIGKRDTGKSWLVKDILYSMRECLPCGAVISGSEQCNHFYRDFVPKVFIHDEYNPLVVYRLLERQKLALQTYDLNKSQGRPNDFDPRAFLILDDCLFDASWTKDKLMRMLFLNGRHWKTMLIITMQYPLGVPPLLRTNVDYVFILRENIRSNRKRIYDNFAGMFDSFEMFCSVMDQTTANFECMVLKNNTNSNHLNDQVFWYRAGTPKQFRIGAKQFWDISETIPDQDDVAIPGFGQKASKKEVFNVRKTY